MIAAVLRFIELNIVGKHIADEELLNPQRDPAVAVDGGELRFYDGFWGCDGFRFVGLFSISPLRN